MLTPWKESHDQPAAAAAAKSLQSCLTLWDPIDGSPPGSPVPGILHARTLEWVAISFSNAWKWKVKVKLFSCVRLLATPWTVAYQALHRWDFPGNSTGMGCHCRMTNIHLKNTKVGKGSKVTLCVRKQLQSNLTLNAHIQGIFYLESSINQINLLLICIDEDPTFCFGVSLE